MSWACQYCTYTSDSKAQLAGHISGHTRRAEIAKKTKSDTHVCKVCQKEFLTGSQLGGHVILHKRSFEELKSSTSRFRRLVDENGRQCENCHQSHWLGELIPLDLDHVDGNSDNNARENLRLLCPNCHRLTETWGRANGLQSHTTRSRLMKKIRSIVQR